MEDELKLLKETIANIKALRGTIEYIGLNDDGEEVSPYAEGYNDGLDDYWCLLRKALGPFYTEKDNLEFIKGLND